MSDGAPYDNLRSETQHDNAQRQRERVERIEQLRAESEAPAYELTRVRLDELAPGERVELRLSQPGGPTVRYVDAETPGAA